LSTPTRSASGITARGGVQTVAKTAARVGRNDPCPCGSGKKYKKCHGTAAHFTRPVNYLGLCGLAVPNGFTAGGLPTSLQIVGHAGDEAMALRIGHAYAEATDWKSRRPPEPAAPRA